MLQALAIYKTLSTEQPVSSTESEIETHPAERDSGRESMDAMVLDSEKGKTEEIT